LLPTGFGGGARGGGAGGNGPGPRGEIRYRRGPVGSGAPFGLGAPFGSGAPYPVPKTPGPSPLGSFTLFFTRVNPDSKRLGSLAA
jgi:hypothetical protein